MRGNAEKIKRLAEIARLYYIEDKNQQEIAEIYGLSRPLISRYLKEAKEKGIVKIEICVPQPQHSPVIEALKPMFGIQGGLAVSRCGSDDSTNKEIASQTVKYLREMKGKKYGIGLGTIIGYVISEMEGIRQETLLGMGKQICPLIGNSGVSARNYHPNELIRVFAEKTGAQPIYLHAPIVVETSQELRQIKRLESYKNVNQAWKRLDIALVNIGNYPATPDFASNIRYGSRLTEEHAVGRLLGYFFNKQGNIIYSEEDYAVQIPLQILRQTKHVIGICSANTKQDVIEGALKTGVFNHIIAPEDVLEKMGKSE